MSTGKLRSYYNQIVPNWIFNNWAVLPQGYCCLCVEALAGTDLRHSGGAQARSDSTDQTWGRPSAHIHRQSNQPSLLGSARVGMALGAAAWRLLSLWVPAVLWSPEAGCWSCELLREAPQDSRKLFLRTRTCPLIHQDSLRAALPASAVPGTYCCGPSTRTCLNSPQAW